MDDLLALKRYTGSGAPVGIPTNVHTLLNTSAWEEALQEDPDKQFAGYVVRGLRNGFRIDAVRGRRIQSVDHNLPSAAQHPGVITEYFSTEARLGRMIGPLLRITIDTEANELQLPEEKLAKLKMLLGEWGDRKACS